MGYIEHSLSDSEALIYRAHFPWFYGASGWVLLIASAACAAVAEWNGYGWLALALLGVGFVMFAAIMLPVWATEIGVTNQRFIFKQGLMWRTTQELQLRAIEEVNLDQGLMGRLLNFGRLELRGTGVDDIRLPSLADPIGLRKALQDGMAAATQSMGPAPTMAPRRPGEVSPSAA
jgi:uncharacterized membrane protein YdbT with pleckstrin-like domain